MRNKNKNIMLDLEKITLNVREIALRAGAFLRNERSGFDRSKVEKKNAHDYVSYVDKAVLWPNFGNCFPKQDSLPKKVRAA